MKKNIDLDDKLFNSLESIRERFHIKSLTPVISMALTVGVEVLKKQAFPMINGYPQTDTVSWPVYSYQTGTYTGIVDNITVG